MIELFQDGAMHGESVRTGLQVLVHGVTVTQDAALGGYDVSALVSDIEGECQVIPWTQVRLNYRWNEKKGWHQVGIPEEIAKQMGEDAE